MRTVPYERARQWRALSFFRSTIGGICLAMCAGAAFAAPSRDASCATDRIDERAVVASVHDGDTLRLKDRRAVRLIGVNTPELPARGEEGEAPEPHALEARDALRKLLPVGSEVGLRFDEERADSHGRSLAHVFTADGTNVQAWLLREGHGMQIVVPPNEWGVDCYHEAEQRARASGRGVWALPAYEAVDVRKLGADASGFHRIRGVVRSVDKTRSGSWWLDLDNDISVRISRKDAQKFGGLSFDRLRGREIVVRGWLTPRDGGRPGAMMVLRHPAALEVLAPAASAAAGRFADASPIPDN